jgi:hypothetical protein
MTDYDFEVRTVECELDADPERDEATMSFTTKSGNAVRLKLDGLTLLKLLEELNRAVGYENAKSSWRSPKAERPPTFKLRARRTLRQL